MNENASAIEPGPQILGCYVAELYRGEPKRGYGYFDLRDGRLRYYSDGGQWYFEAGTGRLVFYITDGSIHWQT